MGTAFRVKNRERMPAQEKTKKAPRFYAVDRIPSKSKTFKPNPTKLRSSITPGTVLIVLSGKFRGKRVVFLKQLDSGLLLVTGPFKLNGVPLRRVNQAYVIATSTTVDVDVRAVANVEDSFFKRATTGDAATAEAEFLAAGKIPEVSISDDRKALQEKVDGPIISAA